ncbi:MAG: alginate export family protein [Candidatus Omnitrophota bacterium]|nr:alginate export family protein [Candidatus Omnitrophota bacterium]
MRRLIVVGLLAFAVALTGTAYAEVQNIKVSGDIDLKGVSHHNYDLKEKNLNFSHEGTGGPDNVSNDDDERFFLSTVHVQVDADLTDNVSTSVRLLNQRKWDNHVAGDDQLSLDTAYVTLREFLYSPLTVIAGRQDLVYGTGFIVGKGRLADPEGVFPSTSTTSASATGQEYSAHNSFDAIRAILDFAPLTVEGLISKNNETGVLTNDEDLYGFIVNYKLDRWDMEIEPYWFYLNDESGARTVTVNDSVISTNAARAYEINRVHTVGMRVAASPIENLKLSGEGAHQFGEMIDTGPAGALIDYSERDRSAWGANVYANYAWTQVPWTPATGIGAVYFSGEEPSNEAGVTGAGNTNQNDDFNAWDSIYRGSFTNYIQDFLGGQDAPANLYTTLDRNDTSAATNRISAFVDASVKPMQDVTLWGRYTRSYFDEAPRPGRDDHAGDEVDVKVLYDYTEDVQLSAFGGWFLPGQYYDDEPNTALRSSDLAWTAGGGATVKF